MCQPNTGDGETGAVAGFADASGGFLPLVCTLNATRVTEAVARLLALSAEDVSALALQASPGADGLIFVPYFDGERTPHLPDASGFLTGIRSDVTRAQLARAAFEGVVCGLLNGADRLRPWMFPLHEGRTFLVGGGARSRAYRQVLADLTESAVHAVTDEELVSRRAAIQASAALQGIPVDEVEQAWLSPKMICVQPTPGVDAAAIRASYDEASKR